MVWISPLRYQNGQSRVPDFQHPEPAPPVAFPSPAARVKKGRVAVESFLSIACCPYLPNRSGVLAFLSPHRHLLNRLSPLPSHWFPCFTQSSPREPFQTWSQAAVRSEHSSSFLFQRGNSGRLHSGRTKTPGPCRRLFFVVFVSPSLLSPCPASRPALFPFLLRTSSRRSGVTVFSSDSLYQGALL